MPRAARVYESLRRDPPQRADIVALTGRAIFHQARPQIAAPAASFGQVAREYKFSRATIAATLLRMVGAMLDSVADAERKESQKRRR